MEQYYKILGELYLNTRIALEEAEQKLAQANSLIEHLKSENLQLKRNNSNNSNNGGVMEHGTMGT